MGHDLSMKSRVHPKYKTKYRVSNWADYDRALVGGVESEFVSGGGSLLSREDTGNFSSIGLPWANQVGNSRAFPLS
jgi:hypothetical protein